jgi:hypothetical protein
MGPISKKLGRRFAKWSGQFRRSARTVPIPKDVRDVETLVKDDYIAAELTGAGYEVKRQGYEVTGSTCYNLEVEIPGRTLPDEIVVIGGRIMIRCRALRRPTTMPVAWRPCSAWRTSSHDGRPTGRYGSWPS